MLCPSPSLWLSLTIRWPGGVDVSGEAFVLAPLDCNLATLKEKKKCISVCLSLSLILSGNKQVPRGLVLVCFCTSWTDRKDTDFKWEFYFLADFQSSVILFVSIFIYYIFFVPHGNSQEKQQTCALILANIGQNLANCCTWLLSVTVIIRKEQIWHI